MYAAGESSPYKEPCKEILAQIALGTLDGVTDPMDWLATRIEAQGGEDDNP